MLIALFELLAGMDGSYVLLAPIFAYETLVWSVFFFLGVFGVEEIREFGRVC